MNPRGRLLGMTTAKHAHTRTADAYKRIIYWCIDHSLAQQWQSNHNKRRKNSFVEKMWAFGLSSHDFSWGWKVNEFYCSYLWIVSSFVHHTAPHQCATTENATREMPQKWIKLIPFTSIAIWCINVFLGLDATQCVQYTQTSTFDFFVRNLRWNQIFFWCRISKRRNRVDTLTCGRNTPNGNDK